MLASIKKCYSILFYPLKKSLYYLYHTILQYLASQNSIFIKILFSNLSLLFLSNRHFFFRLWHVSIPGLSNSIFFPLSPSTPSTGSTHRTTHTDPWYTDQPIQTHHHTHKATHTHTHTNTNHQHSHTHKPSINNNGQHTDHHTHHPSHRSANPNHRSETHAVDLKPTGANPFKKNHHRSHHRSYRWSTQLIHPSINRSIVSNPPLTDPSP